jgi:hypothetical protein
MMIAEIPLEEVGVNWVKLMLMPQAQQQITFPYSRRSTVIERSYPDIA